MIDIHSHIIFDIDDGAEDLDTSIELCKQAYENGFSGIVATPHFTDYKNIRGFVMERDSKLDTIREALSKEGVDITLYSGAELYLNKGIFTASDLDALTINNSRYMLCEFPLGPFNVEEGLATLVELTDRGYVPIVAHPERYYEVYNNMALIDRLLRRGAIFQVNADSICGRLGETAQTIATDLILDGYAKFIASDAHDLVHRNMDFSEKFSTTSAEITRKILVDCFKVYPNKVIKDIEINI